MVWFAASWASDVHRALCIASCHKSSSGRRWCSWYLPSKSCRQNIVKRCSHIGQYTIWKHSEYRLIERQDVRFSLRNLWTSLAAPVGCPLNEEVLNGYQRSQSSPLTRQSRAGIIWTCQAKAVTIFLRATPEKAVVCGRLCRCQGLCVRWIVTVDRYEFMKVRILHLSSLTLKYRSFHYRSLMNGIHLRWLILQRHNTQECSFVGCLQWCLECQPARKDGGKHCIICRLRVKGWLAVDIEIWEFQRFSMYWSDHVWKTMTKDYNTAILCCMHIHMLDDACHGGSEFAATHSAVLREPGARHVWHFSIKNPFGPCFTPHCEVRFLVDGSKSCPMPQPRRPTAAVITESPEPHMKSATF